MNWQRINDFCIGTKDERTKPFNLLKMVAVAAVTAALGCGIEYNVMGYGESIPVSAGRMNPGIIEKDNRRRIGITIRKEKEPEDEDENDNESLEARTATAVLPRWNEESAFEPYTPNPRNLRRVEQKYFQYREVLEVAKVLFAEAGNQSRENRRLIARMIVNRLYTPGYEKTIWGIIHRDNSFSCTFDGSLQWKKAIGKAHRNEYEEREFQRCLEDASAVMQHGWTLGIPEERDLIAYHDISIGKPEDKVSKKTGKVLRYWSDLQPVKKVGRLVWYVKTNGDRKE